MSKDMVRDILIKAAEDVQSGMWCKGHYFHDAETVHYGNLFSDDDLLSDALASRRCAEGSLMVATKLLGGSRSDYANASEALHQRLRELDLAYSLIAYNDEELPDDPFDAGQQLAELFRNTAEAL